MPNETTQVKNNASERGLGQEFLLRPGLNNVPSKIWDEWKTHPQIVELLKSKSLEVDDNQVAIEKPSSTPEQPPSEPPRSGLLNRRPASE